MNRLRVVILALLLCCSFSVSPSFGQEGDPPKVIPPVPEEEDPGLTPGPGGPVPGDGSAQSGKSEGKGDVEAGKEPPDGHEQKEEAKPLPELPIEEGEEGGEEEVAVEAEAKPDRCACYPAPEQETSLVKKLSKVISTSKLKSDEIGMVAVTYPEGDVLFAHNAAQLYNPASVTKIFTSVAVLKALGTGRRYTTKVFQEAGECGALVLQGAGDPGLSASAVGKLARQVVQTGTKCAAELKYDISLFDSKNLPPAYEQKQGNAGYRAKTGALGMEYGAVWVNAYPTRPGEPGRLETDPPTGCISLVNKTTTAEPGEKIPADERLSATIAEKGGGLQVVARGRIPVKRTNGVSVSLALPDPDMFTVCYFAEQLKMGGVVLRKGTFSAGRASSSAAVVGQVPGNSSASDVVEMSRNSRNYMAEQMVKLLSEGRCKQYSFKCGLKVVAKVASEFGVEQGCLKLKNGSGLYDANRVSPGATVKFLLSVLTNDEVQRTFVKSLAVNGKSGTLHDRLRKSPLPVLAKTGTLDDVSALAGYIDRKGGQYVAFAIYVNVDGGAVRHRKLIDDLVMVLADAVKPVKKKGKVSSGKDGRSKEKKSGKKSGSSRKKSGTKAPKKGR